MKVFIGADHRGFELKEKVVEWLRAYEVEFVDLGAHELMPEDDYNDIAKEAAQAVVVTQAARAVLVCGSGNGECIQANRFRGVRAINGLNVDVTMMGRRHNDANVLCLAADFLNELEMSEILRVFFETPFDGDERHRRRIRKLDEE